MAMRSRVVGHPQQVVTTLTPRAVPAPRPLQSPLPKLDGPIVTINILYGDGEKKPVFVHKSYVCAYSKYFRSAFHDGFAETEAREIDLEETNLETFNEFLHWTYHRSLPTLNTANQFTAHVRLWIFADRFIVPKLQNHIMGILGEYLYRSLTSGAFKDLGTPAFEKFYSLLEYVYDNTTETSRLRRVLADCLAVTYRNLNPEKMPLEMIRDVFKSVQSLPADGGVIRRNQGYYFVNEDID